MIITNSKGNQICILNTTQNGKVSFYKPFSKDTVEFDKSDIDNLIQGLQQLQKDSNPTPSTPVTPLSMYRKGYIGFWGMIGRYL
jgi:hypothetical protein